jgi:AcrR family transcriptional regulator
MSIRRLDWQELVPSFARLQPLAPTLARVDPIGPRPGVRRSPSAEARAIVARMAGFGFSATKISRLTGYRPSTLYRFFRDELQTARDLVDLEVLQSAFDQAVGGRDRNFRHAIPSMTRLWLGHRLGWKEPTAYDNPMKVEVDLDRLSDDELNELDRILERASDAGAGEGGAAPPRG